MEEDFWTVTGDLITRRHQVPRKTLYMPKAADFPLPLEYVDIFRTTYTDLDSTKEKKIKITGQRDSMLKKKKKNSQTSGKGPCSLSFCALNQRRVRRT